MDAADGGASPAALPPPQPVYIARAAPAVPAITDALGSTGRIKVVLAALC